MARASNERLERRRNQEKRILARESMERDMKKPNGEERARKKREHGEKERRRIESGPRDVLGPVVPAPLRDVSESPPYELHARKPLTHRFSSFFPFFFVPRRRDRCRRRNDSTKSIGHISSESRHRKTNRISLFGRKGKSCPIGEDIRL